MQTELGAKHLIMVLEPTGTYGDALRWQFAQHGTSIYRVNPKHTHDQSESFDGIPSSHDAKSAYIIADLHLRGCSQLWQEMPIQQRELCGLVNELEMHQTVHFANLNRLSAQLARHWPELDTIADIGTVSVLSLLHEYGDPQSIVQNELDADDLLRRVGRSGLKPEKRQAILNSAQKTLGIPCTPNERNYICHLSADLLRTHQASLDVEKRMVQVVGEHEALTEVSHYFDSAQPHVFIQFGKSRRGV